MNKREKKRLRLLCKLCGRLDRNIMDRHLRRLSIEQLQYINHRLGIPCYVEACPGSGKTEVVGMKAAYEFAGWRDRFAGIAVLTFTRNAAAEIRERVIRNAGSEAAKHPHFIGTIDSWLHNYLLQPFAHRITGYAGEDGDKSMRVIESDSRAGFLNSYKVVARRDNAILANEYYRKCDGSLESATRSITKFDQGDLADVKERFLRDGFATYQDAEYICYQVLRRNLTITELLCRRFPYIIVDECQDLSDTQMFIFHELLKEGAVMHLVGDLNQAIWEFRKVNPEHICSFIQKQGFRKKTLANNYRSNQRIVDFCSRLIQPPYTVQGCEPAVCDPSCVLWQYTDDTFELLPSCFDGFVAAVGLDSRECCIVARGTALLKRLHPQKERRTSPVELFAVALNCWSLPNRSTIDIGIALHNVGKSLSLLAYLGRGQHQKQYCPDSLDPKVWRIFLADVLDRAVGLYPFPQGKRWSQWTGELRGYLEGVWSSLPVEGEEWSKVSRRVRAPRSRGGISIAEEVRLVSPASNLRITTIHDVKGETFDAVLLVSAENRRSPGGHFEHWLHPTSGNEEHRRFAYVACSRPKHLLVIATPSLQESQLREFRELGLEPQNMLPWRPADAESASAGNGVAA